jgi:hypothetical protein
MIEYKLNEAELLSFLEIATAQSAGNQIKSRLVFAGLISIISAAVLQRTNSDINTFYLWLLWFPILVGVWYFMIWKCQKQNLQNSAKKSISELGAQTLSFNPENLRLVSAKSDTTFAWSGITGFSITHGLVILWQSKTQGIVVPEFALDSSNQKVPLMEILSFKGIPEWA